MTLLRFSVQPNPPVIISMYFYIFKKLFGFLILKIVIHSSSYVIFTKETDFPWFLGA